MTTNTIAAIATAPGQAGIAIIRLSGSEAKNILKKTFRPKNRKCAYLPNKMYFGEVFDGEEFIDQALAVFFQSPRSYTGEDTAEIQCHGGSVVAERILRTVLKNGAEMAEPGEFTKRAFMNGKLDLSQAEAIMDMIGALSEKSAKESAKNLKGSLKESVTNIQRELTDVIAQVEAGIEYPEEDLEEVISEEQIGVLAPMSMQLARLAESYQNGKMLREGVKTAIAGRPNVGKSSLLNLILGEERAIVTKIEGTTRDILNEYFIYRQIPIMLMDTAGIRETEDEVEKIGVERSMEAIDLADIVLFLIDGSRYLTMEDIEIFTMAFEKPHIIVLNKSDLSQCVTKEDVMNHFGEEPILVSCRTGEGKEELLEKLYSFAAVNDGEDPVLQRQRQYEAVIKAKRSLDAAILQMQSGMDLDCASIDLQAAWQALGEISGSTLTEDIIDRIFEKFCLGK